MDEESLWYCINKSSRQLVGTPPPDQVKTDPVVFRDCLGRHKAPLVKRQDITSALSGRRNTKGPCCACRPWANQLERRSPGQDLRERALSGVRLPGPPDEHLGELLWIAKRWKASNRRIRTLNGSMATVSRPARRWRPMGALPKRKAPSPTTKMSRHRHRSVRERDDALPGWRPDLAKGDPWSGPSHPPPLSVQCQSKTSEPARWGGLANRPNRPCWKSCGAKTISCRKRNGTQWNRRTAGVQIATPSTSACSETNRWPSIGNLLRKAPTLPDRERPTRTAFTFSKSPGQSHSAERTRLSVSAFIVFFFLPDRRFTMPSSLSECVSVFLVETVR